MEQLCQPSVRSRLAQGAQGQAFGSGQKEGINIRAREAWLPGPFVQHAKSHASASYGMPSHPSALPNSQLWSTACNSAAVKGGIGVRGCARATLAGQKLSVFNEAAFWKCACHCCRHCSAVRTIAISRSPSGVTLQQRGNTGISQVFQAGKALILVIALLCVYMSVHVCVCMCTCVRVYIRVHICVYVCVHIYIYIYMCERTV